MINTTSSDLRSGLLLLSQEEGVERHTGNLDNLETATWNITFRFASLSESGDQHFVVLVDVVKATVAGNEASDLLSVLNELHSDTLTDSGVRLLGLKANLLNNNALGHTGSSQGIGLHVTHRVRLVVRLTGPSVDSAVSLELASSAKS